VGEIEVVLGEMFSEGEWEPEGTSGDIEAMLAFLRKTVLRDSELRGRMTENRLRVGVLDDVAFGAMYRCI
jgi:hypothetical protein